MPLRQRRALLMDGLAASLRLQETPAADGQQQPQQQQNGPGLRKRGGRSAAKTKVRLPAIRQVAIELQLLPSSILSQQVEWLDPQFPLHLEVVVHHE